MLSVAHGKNCEGHLWKLQFCVVSTTSLAFVFSVDRGWRVTHGTLQTCYDIFYVLVTVHRNKFLHNKTNQMHQFPKFPQAWNSTCFGQFLCPSSGVYSLYTRHCYISYRYEDSYWAGPGWNCNDISCMYY